MDPRIRIHTKMSLIRNTAQDWSSVRGCNEVVAGDAVPVLAGADHAEAPRVHGPHDRAQDGHREQEELHRGADPPGQERPDRAPGRIQQGGLTGIQALQTL